jgi:tetratricopeptide (TPR) repeat protein
VEISPRSAPVQLALGLLHSANGENDAAIAALNEALKANPRLARAELELGRIYSRTGRLADAEHYAQAAVTKIPNDPEANLLLAQVALKEGDIVKAEPPIRGLIKLAPNTPAVLTALGRLEALKKNVPAARQAYERAVSKNPIEVEALDGLVALDLAAGHKDAAKTRVDAAVQKAPKNSDVLLLASRAHGAAGDFAESERLALASIEADTNNLPAYELLGQIYAYQHRLDEALKKYQALADRLPKSAMARTMLGVVLQAQNKPADARQRYEEAIAIDPRAAVAANNLAWFYAEDADKPGNLERALELARTAKSSLPNRPEVSDTLGWILFKKGEYQLAVSALQEATSQAPSNAAYLYHLGMAYARMGKRDDAAAALRKSLALDNTSQTAALAKQALDAL